MVRLRLTERAASPRFAETLQQSLSANAGGQTAAGRLEDSAMPKTSVRKMLSRFRRNRRGSTAVEVALVAPVFFALLFAILETAIVFFADQVLETMTQNSARMIMTGQAQTAAYTQAQ